MKQTTLSARGFDRYNKTTRRAAFLAEMDRVVPWSALCALIEPVYPKAGNGRPPVGLERMLRIYFLQNWFNLSDPAVEEALYDSLSMREFVGIDLGREGALDETTVCKFRHLLEQHGMGQRLFEEVGRHLQTQGLKVSTGTIIDATIITAPSSTKNQDKARDPEIHQTKKGNQWYFGMKVALKLGGRSELVDAEGHERFESNHEMLLRFKWKKPVKQYNFSSVSNKKQACFYRGQIWAKSPVNCV